jgi:hypothetical protein
MAVRRGRSTRTIADFSAKDSRRKAPTPDMMAGSMHPENPHFFGNPITSAVVDSY